MNPSAITRPVIPDAAHLAAERDAPATAALQVQTLMSAAELMAIAPTWESLHAVAAAASVFNSWMWQAAWWEVYGRDRPLRILIATSGSAVIGILALYLDSAPMLGLPVRRLRFVGTGGDTHPDDLGPLLAPGKEHAAAAALARAALAVKGFDVLDLSDLDPRSCFAETLRGAAQEAGLAFTLKPSQKISYLKLPPDWHTYLRGVGTHRRLRMRNSRNKVQREHAARFFVWNDAASLDRGLARLAELHQKRWAGKSASFVSREYLDLHLAVMHDCLQSGWLRLYCLELDGEIAAMIYGYCFRRQVFMMQCGFDPDLAKLGPGSVLLGYALEHAIGEGNEVFDFLRGEHAYKDALATGSRLTTHAMAFRPTMGAAAYRARHTYLPRAKARLASALRV